MNIAGLNISLSQGMRSRVAGWLAKSLGAQAFLRGSDLDDAGGAALRSAIDQSVWVYACIGALGTKLASVPFRFTRGVRGGDDLIEAGPLVDLFNQPHPELDRFTFWQRISDHLELRGQALLLALDGSGRPMRIDRIGRNNIPAALLPIDAAKCQAIVENHRLFGWHYTASPNESPLPTMDILREEVIWIRRPHPNSFFDALPPLSIAMLAARTDFAAAQFMKGLMENNADTGVIVRTDQQLTPEQREAILAALKDRKRKAGTADRPLLLWGGAELQKPALSSTDMQFLENRKFNRQEICAVFGVPEQLLGFTEDANRAVSVTVKQGFVENTILPRCSRLETIFLPIIQRIEPGAFGWWDTDALPEMQEARRARFVSAAQAFGIGVPIDKVSDLFDLGLPALPHNGRSYLPFSLQEVGGMDNPGNNTAPTADPVDPVDPVDLVDPEDDQVDPASKAVRALDQLSTALRTQPHVCAGNPDYEASIAGSIRLKSQKLKRFFFEQRGRVLQAVADGKLGGKSTRSIEDIFDLLAENTKILERMTPLLKGDLLFGGGQLFDELGLGNTFDLAPSKAIEFLANRKNEIEGINSTTFAELKTSLQEALDTGETQAQIEDRVREVFKGAAEYRVETIATTETNIAVQSGRHIGMQAAGVTRKGWQTSHLENTRPTHIQCEGLSNEQNGIGISELWPNGLLHPGDPQGSAGEVINCRCFGFAIVDGMQGVRTGKRLLRWEEWSERAGLTYKTPGTGEAHCVTNDSPDVLQRDSAPLHR